MNRNEQAEPKSISRDAPPLTGTAWRMAQAASMLGFVGLFALIVMPPATTALWTWLAVVALWLVPGGWIVWVSWRFRRSS
jgi:hypothetical protein